VRGEQRLPEDVFEPTFPAGAWVTDHRTGSQWIVRDDGSKRWITPSEIERGVTRAELVATGSNTRYQMHALADNNPRALVLAIVVVAVVIICRFCFVWPRLA
jgi:hypothetical protein